VGRRSRTRLGAPLGIGIGPSSRRELRAFGFVVGALFLLVLGIVPWWRHHDLNVWPWVLCGLLWCMALVAPNALAGPHRLWVTLGRSLGWINTRIALSAVFFLMVTPCALLLRLLRSDPLARAFDSSVETYAVPRAPLDRENMRRPY
jgi:hypothetical protein